MIDVDCSTKSHVAIVTLQRPDVLNALSRELLTELDEALSRLSTDPEVRVVVIQGAGRAFCAGADINELDGIEPSAARDFMAFGQDIFDRLERMPQPSIAALHGYVLGGGLELAMSCTFRVAAEGTQLAHPEIVLANIPGWGGTQRLPELIGTSAAYDLILTGRRIATDEARRLGLVQRVCVPDRLDATVEQLAADLAQYSPFAVTLAKQAIQLAGRGREGFEFEQDAVARCCGTSDQRDATGRFIEQTESTG